MAKKEITPAAPAQDTLITLTKDGETIKAHPDQVALWIQQGWTLTA